MRACFGRNHLCPPHGRNVDNVNYTWVADRDVQALRMWMQKNYVWSSAKGNIREHTTCSRIYREQYGCIAGAEQSSLG